MTSVPPFSTAFKINESLLSDFDVLVEIFNEMTPHLPYVWRRWANGTYYWYDRDAGTIGHTSLPSVAETGATISLAPPRVEHPREEEK